MNELIRVTFIGFLSGILGTGIGGISVLFINEINKRYLSFILEFSAGLMISVVCFKLVPESFETGGTKYTLIGLFIGIITIILIENHIIVRQKRALKSKYIKTRFKKTYNPNLFRAGLLMALAIAIHNFPEGFAVGSGFKSSSSLGISLTLAIVIHDIPEGVAMAIPLRAGGVSKIKSFLYTILSGLPMGIGAFLGSLFGGISRGATAVCLGFAGGTMLYVVFGQLVPESKQMYKGRFSSIGNILGILVGIIISHKV